MPNQVNSNFIVPKVEITNPQLAYVISNDLLVEEYKISQFKTINNGKANTNIYFEINSDKFIFRIYTGNANSIDLEINLAKTYKEKIPMPEFLANGIINNYPYVIQRYKDGVDFDQVKIYGDDKEEIYFNIGKTLALISSIELETSYYFDKDLSIKNQRYENILNHINDILFKGNIILKLGTTFSRRIYEFVEQIVNEYNFDDIDFKPIKSSLVHGDYKPSNILLSKDLREVVAVLDWEYSFAGNYLYDIGTFIRYGISKNNALGFEQGFNCLGEKLPVNWQQLSIIADISNLLEILVQPNNKSEVENNIISELLKITKLKK